MKQIELEIEGIAVEGAVRYDYASDVVQIRVVIAASHAEVKRFTDKIDADILAADGGILPPLPVRVQLLQRDQA